MASILQVGEKWRALIRRKGYKAQCKTFRTKAAAQQWARRVEGAIDDGRAEVQAGNVTLARVIEVYRDLREASRPISDQSNEEYMLRRLKTELGQRFAAALVPHDLVDYCRGRRDDGAGPYTCNMEVSKLGTVMRYAAAALRVTLPDVVGAARPLLTHLALIGGGGKRERRPTEDELQGIVTWLREQRGALYADVVRFAVATAMRRGEIVRLLWDDVDTAKRLVLVRDRKDPRRKTGNDQWVPLLGAAWDLVKAQPRGEARIFPLHAQTISKYFLEACRALSVPDLHFHDLRHEGTSRLFEQGFAIQQVALVTGHKSWNQLRRYTQLKPESLHRDLKLEAAQ